LAIRPRLSFGCSGYSAACASVTALDVWSAAYGAWEGDWEARIVAFVRREGHLSVWSF
jgi:hypothetical protein